MNALIPVLGLACNAAASVAGTRWGGLSLLRAIYAGFLAGEAAVVAAHAVAGFPAGAGGLAADLASAAFLGYAYFHFVNLGETGRRVRLLRELDAAPDGLTIDELLARYDARRIVDARLGRLLRSGQLVLADGRYRTGRPVMAWMSAAIVFAKKLVLGRASEFDAPL